MMSARKNQAETQLASLTSLRFFAALCVVVHHVAEITGPMVLVSLIGRLGWLGVSFFFILSGFVLMWSFEQSIGPGAYVMRRLTRIYPLHFVCLTTSLAYFWLTKHPLGGYEGTPAGTIANFLLIHDWLPGHPHTRQAWNGVSWTLSCEFFFYLLAPVVFPFFMKISQVEYRLWAGLIWLVLVSFILISQEKAWAALLDFFLYNPLPRALEFFLGALGARWIKAGFRVNSGILSLCLMSLPVLSYSILVPEAAICPALMNALFMPGAFLFILWAAGADYDGLKSWLQNNFFVRFGAASFALYMTHALLLAVYERVTAGYFRSYSILRIELVVIYLFMAVILSLIVHGCFEFPMRKWLLSKLKRHFSL